MPAETLHRYAIRVTQSVEFLAIMFASWVPYCRTIIAYQHDDGARIHCHLAVETYYDKKTLKNEAGKNYRFKGQADWSFKNWDGGDKYLIYCAKGKLLPAYLHTNTPNEWPPEKFQSFIDRWVETEKEPTRIQAVMDQIGEYADIRAEWLEQSSRENAIADEFDYLLRQVRNHLLLKHGEWSQATFNLYKSVVYTYVMWNNIYIPETRKEWKRFM